MNNPPLKHSGMEDPLAAVESADARVTHAHHHMNVIIAVCWILIGLKCIAVTWATQRYHVPFSPLWIILPTLAFAALATGLYYRLRDR